MYLFFDTETTGIPKNYKAPASDSRNWPRLVQLAWLLVDKDGNEQKSVEHIIKPNGFSIPADAARIHGITNEVAAQKGVELKLALEQITADFAGAKILIAHNMSFDEKILGAELLRTGFANQVESMKRKCTMLASVDLCAIPGNYGNKWPKLQELYKKLFQQEFADAHNALADVRACAKCYFELKRLGVMK
ncbi:MAG: 3'-5' exonuclease [Burkholderiales bacterium]